MVVAPSAFSKQTTKGNQMTTPDQPIESLIAELLAYDPSENLISYGEDLISRSVAELRRLAEENERLKAQIAAPRVTADMWKELVVAQNTLLSVRHSRTEREERLNAAPQPAAPTQEQK